MSDDKFKLEKAFDLDATLDDIEDLPGFGVFPSGAYQIELHEGIIFKKDVGGHPAMSVNMKLEQMMELTEGLAEGEKEPQPGDICGTAFMMDNKVGADAFKKFVAPIAERLQTKKLSDLVVDEKGAGANKSKGMKLLVILKRTYNKDKDQHYAKLKKVAVL